MTAQSTGATKPVRCGGIDEFKDLGEDEKGIWNMYKEHLEGQIKSKFNVPTSHTLKPVKVATQVVAGKNYFFKVELPEQKYATARVYHVPWQAATHGKKEQVSVHDRVDDGLQLTTEHF